MKIYLAGPMRGYPDFNFPAFDAAATHLRAQGHEVFSPPDRDRAAHGEGVNRSATGTLADVPEFDLRAALADDLAWICKHAEMVVVLDGWEASLGAQAEVSAANALDVPVVPYAAARS